MSDERSTGRERRARRILAAVCAAAVLVQVTALVTAWQSNPFTRTPINDARVYWDWSAEIASGKLALDTPFLSAPLYPYFLGLLRALGAGLFEVYLVQIALHVATAALLYRVALRRFDASVALASAVVWLLVADAEFHATRVLGSTLQAFVLVLAWERLLAFRERATPLSAAVLGVLLGACVLANPILLGALPLLLLWAVSTVRERRVELAIVLAACAGCVVLSATLHNRLASGELIPVSAQGGITFLHGNAPGADGTYHPIPGISSDRVKQNVDARTVAGGGTPASWNETSSYLFARGLAWWRAEPGAALVLALRKAWWFVAGRNYGDIYLPALERADGFAPRVPLAPLPAAWLLLPGLVFALGLARSPREHLPELLLFAVPFATVVVFWYSPRYRFPALPFAVVLAVAAARELALAWRARAFSPRAALFAAAFAIAVASGPLGRAAGFDRPEQHRAQYELALGNVLLEQGELERAVDHFRRAAELGSPDALAALGDGERRLGRRGNAVTILRDSVRADPRNAYARRSLAVALAEQGELEEARREFEAALALDPNDWESLSGLGNVLLGQGEIERAVESYRAALALNGSFASARSNLAHALASQGLETEAEQEFRAALALDRGLLPARTGLANLLSARGAHAEAIALLREARELWTSGRAVAPEEIGAVNLLARLLATSPEARDRDGKEALALAERLVEATGEDPGALDTLAAAQAESGRFEDATQTAERSVAKLRELGAPPELVLEVEGRQALYRARTPYRLGPP